MIDWKNDDLAVHKVTSSGFQTSKAHSQFNSEMMQRGRLFFLYLTNRKSITVFTPLTFHNRPGKLLNKGIYYGDSIEIYGLLP